MLRVIPFWQFPHTFDNGDLIPAYLDLTALKSFRFELDIGVIFELATTFGLKNCFHWSILKDMTGLKTVQFAMVGTVDDDWLFRDNFDEEWWTRPVGDGWEDSIQVNGLVKSIVEFVPGHVELKWGPWEELGKDFDKAEEGARSQYYLTSEVLAKIAKDYDHIRGRYYLY